MSSTAIHLTNDQQSYRDRYPDLGTGPVPVEPYMSEEYLSKECEHIFSKMWLMVGRTTRLKNVGDFFVKNVECLNKSIVPIQVYIYIYIGKYIGIYPDILF